MSNESYRPFEFFHVPRGNRVRVRRCNGVSSCPESEAYRQRHGACRRVRCLILKEKNMKKLASIHPKTRSNPTNENYR
jgi:hypothetical protein